MSSSRRALTLAIAAFAFTFAWLAPRIAHATILPACELREQVSLAPAAAEPPARLGPLVDDPAGDAATMSVEDDAGTPPADDIADVPGIAPMSDARGASAIAPPRVRAVVDGGKIEAVTGCPQLDTALTPADEAGTSTPTLGAGPGIVAVLHDATPTLGPAPHPALELSYPPPSGGPLSGVRRGIERPPR